MNVYVRTVLSALLLLGLSASVDAADRTIKVFRVGSSSFSYTLIQDIRAIVEASGK